MSILCPYHWYLGMIDGSWTCILGWVTVAWVALAWFLVDRVKQFQFFDKVCVVTGGSTGIGLEIAKQLAARGAHVYIAARRQDVLDAALKEIVKTATDAGQNTTHQYGTLSFDVCDEAAVQKAIQKVHAAHGRIDLLICNAGFSIPSRFLDISSAQAKQQFDINFFGCTNVVRAVLPGMHERRSGRVVLTSSMAGAAPVAGFSLYGATKAALRAFAQSMDMENAAMGVRFQILNPPDVATPGYEEENKLKSEECKQICAMGGNNVFKATDCAKAAIEGIQNYSFQINLGFDGHLLGLLVAGMEPPTSVRSLLLQSVSLGIVRFVSAVYVKLHYGIVKKVRAAENKK